MKIYKLTADVAQYGSLEIFNTEELITAFGVVKYRKLRSVQTSIADKWPKSHGGFYDMYSQEAQPLSRSPDVYLWMNVFLMLSPRAMEVLHPLLHLMGEFLTFECDDQEYYLFAAHNVVEPDLSQSHPISDDQGGYGGVASLAFKASSIGTQILFKTNFDRFSHLYCTEQFKRTIDSAKLKGLLLSSDLSSKV